MKPNMKERSTKTVDASKEGPHVCRQCGRVNRQIKTGSLTSWLFADNRCQCESKPTDKEEPTFQQEDLILEGFDVLNVIGHGGMGTVFKVKKHDLGDILAIKLMRADLAKDPLSVKRFEQEIESCMTLTHKNLPTVYGMGRSKDGRPYLVMDYLEGMTLQTLLAKEGFLEPARALSIFLKVSEVLLYAHQHGIIHRDIKPSNIFILSQKSGEDDVKVLDFGIARVLKSDQTGAQTLTSTGEIFGSPLYMSPEQCRGEEVDTRSDIYSLGCVLYETLCGKSPFQGKNPIQTILKHLSDDEPESLISKKLGVSTSLQNVVYKCLAKKPEHRYNNFDELQRDLALLKSGVDVDVQIVNTKKRQSKAKTVIIRLMQACIIFLIALTAFGAWILFAFQTRDIASLTLEIEKNPQDWESYLNRARQYQDNGRSTEAMSDLNKALKLNPNSYWALIRRSAIFEEYGEYDKALKDYDRAISIFPSQRNAYINRAILYIDNGRYKEAINDCTEGLARNPFNLSNDNFLTYYLRSEAYVEDGQYDLAIADINKANELPRYSTARSAIDQTGAKQVQNIERGLLLTRAKALAGKAAYGEALKYVNEALITDPKSIEVLSYRATVYINLNEREKADEDLSTLLDLESDNSDSYLSRGTNRMFMGRIKEALEDLSLSINAAPGKPDAYKDRGYAYFVAGDYAKALKDFRKCLELTKNKHDAFSCGVGEYFCNQLLNNRSSTFERKEIGQFFRTDSSHHAWYIGAINYLNDEISATQFRDLSLGNVYYLQKANCYIGLKQYLDGKKKWATTSFNLVQDEGSKTSFEFAVAQAMLKKIESETQTQ